MFLSNLYCLSVPWPASSKDGVPSAISAPLSWSFPTLWHYWELNFNFKSPILWPNSYLFRSFSTALNSNSSLTWSEIPIYLLYCLFIIPQPSHWLISDHDWNFNASFAPACFAHLPPSYLPAHISVLAHPKPPTQFLHISNWIRREKNAQPIGLVWL